MAKRELSEEEYLEWNDKFQEAALTIKDRDRRLEETNARIEKGLTLIGSSAIEDKLQTEVSETLKALKSAGIKIWVLTGDKVETAINIGYSAGLLDKNMISIVIESSEHEEVKDELGQAIEATKRLVNKRVAIIIRGETLTVIHAEREFQEMFMSFASKAEVVIACRVSPKQKGDVVDLVKSKFPQKTTLAIGDGANDVTMIMKADVGIGIAGREGMQAARSSDFSIG
jgi:magnesium-transporting ATPase (P-type)